MHDRPIAEPHNLGKGWMGFDFAEAFKRETKVINDAAMQALGSYRNGRMLFLGLGTGLGSTMIVDGIAGESAGGTADLPAAFDPGRFAARAGGAACRSAA